MTKTPAADMLKSFRSLSENRMDWPVFLADDDDVSSETKDVFHTEILSIFVDDTDGEICLLLLDLNDPQRHVPPFSAAEFIEKLAPLVSDYPTHRVIATILGEKRENYVRFDIPIVGMAACQANRRIYLGASGFRKMFIDPPENH